MRSAATILALAASAALAADPATLPLTVPVESPAAATQPATLPAEEALAAGLASPATSPATVPATQAAATAPTTQVAQEPSLIRAPGGGLILNFKEAAIDAVLDQLSEFAGFVVVKDKDTRVEGRVTLLSRQPVSPDEAIVLLNAVLKNNGYAAVQTGRILKVMSYDRAKRSNIPVCYGVDPTQIPPTDDVITQVMPLRFVDAMQLKQDLSTLIGVTADLAANASSNSLILTDTSANIRRIAQIIQQLDKQMADAVDVRVFALQHASAATAARLINDVFQQNNAPAGGGGGAPGGGGRGGRGGAPGGGSPGAFAQRLFGAMAGGNQNGGARQQAKVIASSDDRTNTVVVSGPPDVLTVIERVLKELDADPAEQQSVLVYNVKNGQAANLQAVLNSLFNGVSSPGYTASTVQQRVGGQIGFGSGSFGGGLTGGGRSGGAFGGNTGANRFSTQTNGGASGGRGGFGGGLSAAALSTAAALAGQVTIVANSDTNSLAIMSNPNNFDRIRQVLDELDRPVQQVLIKVLIAEVSHDNTHDLGAEFSLLNLRAGTSNALGHGPLGTQGGSNFGVAQQSGGLTYKLLENNAEVAIRALETSDKTDVLSRPYVLASDNQLATIMVGQQIPIVTRTQLTDTGTQNNSYQYQPVGIILNVTPHINPEGLVTLDVAPEISALTSQFIEIQPGVKIPVIASRSAESRVSIRDGQTIVFGGLMEDRMTDHVNKVPILGDIPGLGLLFQSKTAKKTKTELLIFMTPRVATGTNQLNDISKQEEQGSRLVPNAVAPGVFNEHMNSMRPPATQPEK